MAHQHLTVHADHVDRALRAWLRPHVDTLQNTWPALTAPTPDAEQVHEARVALRKMRAAWALVRGLPHTAPAAALPDLVLLFRHLGAHRDADVTRELLIQTLGPRWAARVQSAPNPTAQPPASLHKFKTAVDALAAWVHAEPPLAERTHCDVRRHCKQRLAHWHRAICRASRHPGSLEVETLHEIRKRLKRLRYALEFIARDMKLDARKPYLKALSATQTALGLLNDLHTAALACQAPHAPPHADQTTAVAVLKHRLTLAHQQAIEELARWRQLRPPWA